MRIPKGWAFLILSVAVICGAFLRLYGLRDQILLDDEWHLLNFVLGKSFFRVLTVHGLGANSIPQNLHAWITLHTVGWSELWLVAPSVVFGILALLVLPPLVARITSWTTAVIFSILLAISPCLIYYSRIARPYSAVVFLGFLSLIWLYRWAQCGRVGYRIAYSLCGFGAIYGHIYAALPVLMPLVFLLIGILVRRLFRMKPADRPWLTERNILWAGGLTVALSLLALAPAYCLNPWWKMVWGQGRVTRAALLNFFFLLSGTRCGGLAVLFIALLIGGLIGLLRRDRLLGTLLGAVCTGFLLFVTLSSQTGSDMAIVVARYNIIFFPVALFLASEALRALTDHAGRLLPPRARFLPSAAILGGLIATSPLWRTYVRPNNFMHHAVFQYAYSVSHPSAFERWPDSDVYGLKGAELSRYYHTVATQPDVKGIIEHPMLVGHTMNLYYFPQRLHRKPVVIGYLPNRAFPPLPSNDDYVYQITPVDYVLSRATRHGARLRFRNMVALDDAALLRQRFSGWHIVVHKDIVKEMFGNARAPAEAQITPPEDLYELCRRHWGEPVFSSSELSAWRIP